MSGFGKFAERVTNPTKVRLRIARARQDKREKQKAEEDYLFSEWRKWHDKRKKELLAGKHGSRLRALVEWLEQMTINDGDELLKLAPAYKNLDSHTKAEILALINARCILLRERNGMPPFDDDLDDPPQTVFLQIRGLLT